MSNSLFTNVIIHQTEYDLINEEIIYPAVKGQKKMQESKEKEGKNIILEEMGEKKPFLRLQECRNALTNVCKKGILQYRYNCVSYEQRKGAQDGTELAAQHKWYYRKDHHNHTNGIFPEIFLWEETNHTVLFHSNPFSGFISTYFQVSHIVTSLK